MVKTKLLKILSFPFQIRFFVFLIYTLAFCFSDRTFSQNEIQRVDFGSAQKLIKHAKELFRKGQISDSEKILRGIIVRNPQNSKAKLNLAYIMLKSRRLMEANKHASEVIQSEPKNPYAFAILGLTYLSSGNFSEARILLYNAVLLNKNEALAWAGIGMLNFYENRLKESFMNLKKAVHLDSKNPDFEYALAQVSTRTEKYREAAKAYKRFLRFSPKTDRERRDRIKGLIKFLGYLGNKSPLYKLGGKKSTTVKIEMLNNRPVIKLRLKKKSPDLRFVLDTGSGISVISNETAKRLKIKKITKGGLARALGGDGRFEIVYGFLNRVYIGDVRIENVPVYIREFHNKKERVDGYIGLSLISKYIATIDYGSGSFSLVRKKLAADLKEEDGSMTLPLRLTFGGFLSGEVKLSGIASPLNFIVDTGASISVISKGLAESSKLRSHMLKERIRVIGAAGITENVPSFLLPNLAFGRFSHKGLKVIALDMKLINENSGFEQAGILGGNFLRNYKLTFDFNSSKVTFVSNNK